MVEIPEPCFKNLEAARPQLFLARGSSLTNPNHLPGEGLEHVAQMSPFSQQGAFRLKCGGKRSFGSPKTRTSTARNGALRTDLSRAGLRARSAAAGQHLRPAKRRVSPLPDMVLGVPSTSTLSRDPILFRKPSKTQKNCWFWKRTTVEKRMDMESQPPKNGH